MEICRLKVLLIYECHLYGCVVWGKDKWPEGEKIQFDMAKRILSCSSTTTREALLGELGWWSLHTRRDTRNLFTGTTSILCPMIDTPKEFIW